MSCKMRKVYFFITGFLAARGFQMSGIMDIAPIHWHMEQHMSSSEIDDALIALHKRGYILMNEESTRLERLK